MPPPIEPSKVLSGKIDAALKLPGWTELREFIVVNPELLSDEANHFLLTYQSFLDDPAAKAHVENVLSMLLNCRRLGVEQAFQQQASLEKHLIEFVRSDELEEARNIVRTHPVLLTAAADALLSRFLLFPQTDSMRARLRDSLDLLRRWRALGPDVAQADRSTLPSDIANLMNSILRLDDKEQAVEKIAACRHALIIINERDFPELWPDLHYFLARALFSLSDNSDAEMERAADAFREAAESMNRLGRISEAAYVTAKHAIAWRDRARGNPAANIERSIGLFELALNFLKPIQFSQLRMTIVSDLVYTYGHRVTGDPIETWERAYELAKSVCDTIPSEATQEWVQAMSALGIVMKNRWKGDRSENIDAAIAVFEEALPFTLSLNDKAAILSNLSGLYSLRTKDGIAQNRERAVKFARAALALLTKDADPVSLARVTGTLANAFSSRLLGDEPAHEEEALQLFHQILEYFPLDRNPAEWIKTTCNLAQIYVVRTNGRREENVAVAIHLFEKALEVSEPGSTRWAQIASELSNSYAKTSLPQIDKAVHLATDALSVVDPVRAPNLWGQLAFTLAGHLLKQNDEQAVALYEQILNVVTPTSALLLWCDTCANLAAIPLRGKNEPTKQTINHSLDLCDRVLQYLTPQSEPKEHRKIQLLRGSILFHEQHWQEAASAFRAGVAATELLFAAAATPQSRLATLAVMRGIEERLVYCEAKNGRLEEAVVAAELARARSLADHLELDLAPMERLKPAHQQEFERLRSRIMQLETEARAPDDVPGKLPYPTIAHELSETYGALAILIEQIQRYFPEFLSALDLQKLRDIAKASPLVYLLATDAGGLALLVDRDGSIRTIWLSALTLKSLFDYYTPWTQAFASENESISDRTDALDSTGSWLWTNAMRSVCEGAAAAGEIVLIPFGLLGLLPLHAACEPQTESSGHRYALDCVRIIYAPSARARGASLEISKRTEATAVLAIENPRPSSQPKLPYAEVEVKAILPFFAGREGLRHKEATREIVLPKLASFSVIHFACHGFASPDDPLSSGLLLANDEILSLRDLLNAKLSHVRIAILSACNTAVLHTQIPEEVISLPTGLLQAGAKAVIGSLWPVSDISTMLLMARFYAAWRRDGMSLPESLRYAQRWLRNSSGKEQLEFLETLSIPAKQMKLLRAALLNEPNSRIFEHPIYWAGFVYVGA